MRQTTYFREVAASFSGPSSGRKGLVSGCAEETFQMCQATSDRRGFQPGGACGFVQSWVSLLHLQKWLE